MFINFGVLCAGPCVCDSVRTRPNSHFRGVPVQCWEMCDGMETSVFLSLNWPLTLNS